MTDRGDRSGLGNASLQMTDDYSTSCSALLMRGVVSDMHAHHDATPYSRFTHRPQKHKANLQFIMFRTKLSRAHVFICLCCFCFPFHVRPAHASRTPWPISDGAYKCFMAYSDLPPPPPPHSLAILAVTTTIGGVPSCGDSGDRSAAAGLFLSL